MRWSTKWKGDYSDDWHKTAGYGKTCATISVYPSRAPASLIADLKSLCYIYMNQNKVLREGKRLTSKFATGWSWGMWWYQLSLLNCFWMSSNDMVADPLLLAFCWDGCSLHPVMNITYKSKSSDQIIMKNIIPQSIGNKALGLNE
jgi:hypothetical protein